MPSRTAMAITTTTTRMKIASTAKRDGVTTMIDEQPGNILRLMTWLSPAFPVGGFSYSHGLERAVHDGLITDRDTLERWLASLVDIGSGWNDAVLFAEAWRRASDYGDLKELSKLAEALAGSRQRHMETTLQGAAFVLAASGWPNPVLDTLPANCAYCVAVGAVAGAHRIALADALAAFLQAFAANLAQVSIRLGVTGQDGAVRTIAALEPLVLATAARAARSTLDDLGSATFLSDIMAMKHETQYSRLFRS
jgi:urease accessory protein